MLSLDGQHIIWTSTILLTCSNLHHLLLLHADLLLAIQLLVHPTFLCTIPASETLPCEYNTLHCCKQIPPLHQTLIFGFKEGNWLGYNQHLDFFGRNIAQQLFYDTEVSQAECH